MQVLQQNDDNLSRRDIFECHHILVEYTYLQEDYTIISRSIINIANLHFPHNRLFPDKNNVLQKYYSKKSGIPKLQCVTKPKIWTKPNPKLFSDTKFFRYRIRYFFRYQFFFDTDTDTFFDTKFFWNWYRYFFRYQQISKPLPILSQQLEKFRNREV